MLVGMIGLYTGLEIGILALGSHLLVGNSGVGTKTWSAVVVGGRAALFHVMI